MSMPHHCRHLKLRERSLNQALLPTSAGVADPFSFHSYNSSPPQTHSHRKKSPQNVSKSPAKFSHCGKAMSATV